MYISTYHLLNFRTLWSFLESANLQIDSSIKTGPVHTAYNYRNIDIKTKSVRQRITLSSVLKFNSSRCKFVCMKSWDSCKKSANLKSIRCLQHRPTNYFFPSCPNNKRKQTYLVLWNFATTTYILAFLLPPSCLPTSLGISKS